MSALIEFSVDISADSLSRWMFGRDGSWQSGLSIDQVVPLSYLVFLRAQPAERVSFHEMLNRDPVRGLYGGVHYQCLRPLRVRHRLRATSTVSDRRQVASPRGVLTITTLNTEYCDNDGTVATEAVQMVDLPQTSNQSAPSATEHVSAMPRISAATGFSRAQIAWLTVSTGDTNALHLDSDYARSRGFRDVVVPAPLITAWAERELEAVSKRPVSDLRIRYMAATSPDDELALHADWDGNAATF